MWCIAKKADGTCFDESYDKLVLATVFAAHLAQAARLRSLEGISFLKLFQQGQDGRSPG